MASNFLCIYVLSFMLFFTSSFQTSLPLPSASYKVSMGLYYESLCPGSVDFIVTRLPEVFENELISIVDLHFYPWGNAQFLSNNYFHCQHGDKECLLNTVEACAIDAWPDVDTHFHFIHCVESKVLNQLSQWETCFDTLGLNRTPVDLCYSSLRAKELQNGYAQETEALKPAHQYVPWVVVDGKPLYDDYENFMTYICQAYKGSPRPNACNGLPNTKLVQVSYKDA